MLITRFILTISCMVLLINSAKAITRNDIFQKAIVLENKELQSAKNKDGIFKSELKLAYLKSRIYNEDHQAYLLGIQKHLQNAQSGISGLQNKTLELSYVYLVNLISFENSIVPRTQCIQTIDSIISTDIPALYKAHFLKMLSVFYRTISDQRGYNNRINRLVSHIDTISDFELRSGIYNEIGYHSYLNADYIRARELFEVEYGIVSDKSFSSDFDEFLPGLLEYVTDKKPQSLMNISLCDWYLGDFGHGIEACEKALNFYEQVDYSAGIIWVYSSLASHLEITRQYSATDTSWQKSLFYARKLIEEKDDYTVVYCRQIIVQLFTFYDKNDWHDKLLDHTTDALDIMSHFPNWPEYDFNREQVLIKKLHTQVILEDNSVLQSLKDQNIRLQSLLKSNKLNKEQNVVLNAVLIENHLVQALIYNQLKEFNKSLLEVTTANASLAQIDVSLLDQYTELTFANLFIRLGLKKKAISILKALTTNIEPGNDLTHFEQLRRISELYAEMEAPDSALLYLSKFSTIKDLIQDKYLESRLTRFNSEMGVYTAQSNLIQEQILRRKSINRLLLLLLVVLSVGFLVFNRNLRLKAKKVILELNLDLSKKHVDELQSKNDIITKQAAAV